METDSPNWKPLEAVLAAEECANFMYMGNVGPIFLYKQYFIRTYLNIDERNGKFYRYAGGIYVEIIREDALKSVGIVRNEEC